MISLRRQRARRNFKKIKKITKKLIKNTGLYMIKQKILR